VTTAPPEAQRRLLEVQALDTRLDQIAHRRANVPALARLIELDSQLADLETALVTSRTAANDLRRAVAKAESDVEQVRIRAVRDEVVAERDAAFAELDADADRVSAQRAEMAAPLDEKLMALYEKMRGRLGGVAVAALRHGRSEASGLMVPGTELARIKGLPPEEIVFCEDSGRILVRGEDAF